MKNPGPGRARNARINQAVQHAEEVLTALKRLKGYPAKEKIDDKDAWFEGRNSLDHLTQCFHEANAYNNCVEN